MFQNFVIEFPLLIKEGKNPQSEFWSKCQQFLEEFKKIKLDTYTPKSKHASQRRVLMYKIEKLFIITLCAAIKTKQDEEYIQTFLATKQQDLQDETGEDEDDQVTTNTKTKLSLYENEDNYLQWIGSSQGLDINVIGVRDIVEKRTLREKIHAEFLVQTNVNDKTYIVAHRHGNFRQLYHDLQLAFPSSDIPPLPSKASDASYSNNNSSSSSNNENSSNTNNTNSKKIKEQVSNLSSSVTSLYREKSFSSFTSSSFSPTTTSSSSSLYREKDRILLRVFLHQIASQPKLAKSSIFETFLTSNPITVTKEQQQDIDKRLAMDQMRLEEERRFREKVDAQMNQLDDLLSMLKQQVVRKGGLLEIFDIIKKTENIQDLPDSLKKAFEWGRINFAFVLQTQFLTSDRAVENTANLKRTHMLMPYRAIAQILKVSNPFIMVKGVMDLFLAQPFGGKSLFQRLISVNMNEENKNLQKNIDDLEKTINDPVLCLKIRNATETTLPEGESIGDTPISETIKVLQNEEISPQLTVEQIKKVALANHNKEAKELVQQLNALWRLYGKRREQDMMMQLVFQGVTGELIKDIFAIFYQPLAQVYKSANIGDSIGDVSSFVEDLIKLLDSLDVSNVSNTSQLFVDLVQRHEQKFYRFVHNVHAQDKSHLFDDLLRYVDSISSFAMNGLNMKEDEYLDLPSIIQSATTTHTLSHDQYDELKKEINDVQTYHQQQKELHAARRKLKIMQTLDNTSEQDILSLLPSSVTKDNTNTLSSLIHGMEELDYNDDDDDDQSDVDSINNDPSSALPHEMTLAPPRLVQLPKLLPSFTKHVSYFMNRQ
ncbi:unnamed protein product [Cunninghamella echinulata]